MTAEDKRSYQCVHCGHSVHELYKDFKKGIIKISHCGKCNEVADKYIEYDSVIIFLDALLLQKPAYSHILLNTSYKGYWRLVLVLWLCDALTKLMQRKAGAGAAPLQPDSVFYSALEVDFYRDYLFSAAESLVFFCCIVSLLAAHYLFKHRKLKHFQLWGVLRGLVVSSMGRLLVVPALIWGESHSALGVAFTHLFVAASNVQALRVVSRRTGAGVVVLVVGLSYLAQAAALHIFNNHFPNYSAHSFFPLSVAPLLHRTFQNCYAHLFPHGDSLLRL